MKKWIFLAVKADAQIGECKRQNIRESFLTGGFQ